MMSVPTTENILSVLRTVQVPAKHTDVVSAGMISGLSVRNGKVGFLITVDRADNDHGLPLRQACERAAMSVPGVESVTIAVTAHSDGEASPEQVSTAHAPARKAVWNKEPLRHVKRVIAVASGKGGVGKSTVAVNLAHAFHAAGLATGIVDADIYGPSLPRMLGISGTPDVEGGLILPVPAHGLLAMSMGLLVGDDAALVWRGPQVSKALYQLLRGVRWGTEDAPLDVLVIDMPPGTGDVQLSLAQQVPVDGAVIVTTPQDVAVADARKSVDMFRKVNIRILGVVENMSGFLNPATGVVHAIFGEGGGARLAEASGVPLLAQVALDIGLRIAGDKGERFTDGSGVFSRIAGQLI